MEDNKDILKKLYERKQSLVNQIDKIKTQLNAIDNAIIGFGGFIEGVKSISIINYPKDGTYEDKIKFILNTHKELPASGIANLITAFENITDTVELNKTHNNITMIASSMYKAGKIHAKKSEDNKLKNIYYL